MRLVLLSRQKLLYTTRRFREAARRRGHTVRILDPLACTLTIGRGDPSVWFEGQEVRAADCVIPRIGAALSGQAVGVVRHFQAMGVPVVNRAEAIARARDKLQSLQILSQRGLDVPATILAREPAAVEAALRTVGGPPVVLKLLQGAQGIGVILAETRGAITATLDTLWGLGQEILIQEFVAESRGRDVRALVVGGRVVAAMQRVAEAGEWRANIHRGGYGEPIRLDESYAQTALEAAAAVGLDVAGVDLLEGRTGPRVIEINASPGFEGLERVTGIDVAGAILTRAEEVAATRRDRVGVG